MRNMHLLIAAAVAGTLLGCGQKGPLVLPDAQHPQKKVGIGKSAATSTPSSSAPRTPSAGGAQQPAAPGPAPTSPP